MESLAFFSADRRYRYWLLRRWDPTKPMLGVIGLNPSTADERTNDNTIVKCIAFAQRLGYGGLLMMNLYGWRATNPRDMWQRHDRGDDIVGGPHNWLNELRNNYCKKFQIEKVIAAWGHDRLGRSRQFEESPWRLDCFKRNNDHSPAHPLYLKSDLVPIAWNYNPQ